MPGRNVIRSSCCVIQRIMLLAMVLLGSVAHAEDWVYTVREGDNPWQITVNFLKGIKYWKPLIEYNQIENPQALSPGTRISIPLEWMQVRPVTAKLIQKQGDVRIFRPGRALPEDNIVIELLTGDRLVTGAGSSATLEFSDGSKMLVLPESELILDTLRVYGKSGMVDTRIRVPAGRVDTRVKPQEGPASRYEIITPAAVAAVRGTEFRVVSARDRALTRSEVMEGKVGMLAGNEEQVVPAGYGLVAEQGKPLGPPRKLLAAPDLAQLPTEFKHPEVSLQWLPVDGAMKYILQLYVQKQFDQLILEHETHEPGATLDTGKPGAFTIRIRAIDEVGLEGLNADHDFAVTAQNEMPVPVLLPPLLDYHSLYLRCEPDTPKASYQYQIALDPEFTRDMHEFSVQEARLVLPRPPPNTYYYRVRMQTPVEIGPYSQTYMIVITPLGYWQPDNAMMPR